MLDWLFDRLGVIETLFTLKSVSIVLAGLFLFEHWAMWFLVAVYVVVVTHNVYQIRKA